MEELYANCINLSGLWFPYPTKMEYDEETESWWDTSGEFTVDYPGLEIGSGYIKFSGTEKEAEIWTDGVKSALTLLNNWSKLQVEEWVPGKE